VPIGVGVWGDGDSDQYGHTWTCGFGCGGLIILLWQFMALAAGDVVCAGTPPGGGRGQKPPVFLKGGEVRRWCIAGLGMQTQKVVRT